MRISHETIYRWIYRDASRNGDLYHHLRRCHKRHRRQKRYGSGRRFIPGRISIDQRPPIVATRERFGNFRRRHYGRGQKYRLSCHPCGTQVSLSVGRKAY
jgi:IS30 family transposase